MVQEKNPEEDHKKWVVSAAEKQLSIFTLSVKYDENHAVPH